MQKPLPPLHGHGSARYDPTISQRMTNHTMLSLKLLRLFWYSKSLRRSTLHAMMNIRSTTSVKWTNYWRKIVPYVCKLSS